MNNVSKMELDSVSSACVHLFVFANIIKSCLLEGQNGTKWSITVLVIALLQKEMLQIIM